MTELTSKELEELSRITRITGDIPEGYGILLIKYDAWFEYEDAIEMAIRVFAKDSKEIKFLSLLADSRNEEATEWGLPVEPSIKSVVKRPYPNKKYVSLVGKNGRRHADAGVPLLAKIEDLNCIGEIEFRLWKPPKNSIYRKFTVPVSVSMTSEENLACLRFMDMTYYNVHSVEAGIDKLRRPEDLVPNLRFLTLTNVEKGRASSANWSWTYHSSVEEKRKKTGDDTSWLKEPEEEFALGYEGSEEILPDSLFLGLNFLDNPDNLIRIVGSKHPFVLMV